jgi:putative ABC transport system permease protein
MSLWRQMTRGLRALTNRAATDQDVTDEVGDYLAHATAAHLARGLPRDAAVREARLELGNVTAAREQVREYGWENLIESVLTDLRYAVRRLRQAPGFTAITVLALGLGATTAIFSAVNPILFRSLPYPNAGRVVAIVETRSDGGRNPGTFAMYHAFAEQSRSFEAMAVLKPWQPTMTGPDQPERLEGQRVSARYFQVLGVPPIIGRDFQPSDDRPNGPRVVILSDALWRRRFSGDRAILGRIITLDDDAYSVIGVMPPGFENVIAPSAELWAPLQYDMALGTAWGHHLRTLGRLRPGVDVDRASQEIGALGQSVLREQHPETYDPNAQFLVASLQSELTRGVRPALRAILGAVLLVLVIACVNVTNLLLARGVQRRGEFALRAALGAGQGRLVRQLLTESLLLAAVGGVVGMALATLGVLALVAVSPPGLPRIGAVRVDGTMFAFALGITTLIGLAFGVVPALQAARSDPHQDLQHGTRRTAGGHRGTRGALVIAEIGLALVLLVSSGLLLRSLERLFAIPSGFEASRLLTLQVQTVGHRFDDDSVTRRFYAQALAAVRRLPGVTEAALTSQLPLSSDDDEYGAHFAAGPTQPAQTYDVFRYAVSPGYLEAMHIPLRRGRLLDERDGVDAPLVALISESLAQTRFEGGDPIGQQLRIGSAGPYIIVGVVGDVKQMSLAASQTDAVYTMESQWRFPDRAMSLIVRGRGDVAGLAPAVRQAVWSVDKDQPVVRVATMGHLRDILAAERRFALILFEAFALAALVLAAAGIYGVLSGSVAERTREIGVRSALGASRAEILGLVVRRGVTLTGLGIALGLVGAVIASRALITLLFGVSRLDPVTYLAVVVLLALVAALASGIPAWRAARIDPAIALRSE